MIENKKGQALIAFIILLPIFLLCFALLIDVGFMVNKNIIIKGIIEVEDNLVSNEDRLNANKIEYTELYKENNCVYVRAYVKSIFGTIISQTKYEILVKKC